MGMDDSFKFKMSGSAATAHAAGWVQRIGKLARTCLWVGVLGLAIAALLIGLLLFASLPSLEGKIQAAHLDALVTVATDDRGVPSIQAQTRADSFRALGFVHANDRLFQMDLMRRGSAGRLAEIFGESAVDGDKWHKVMGFEHVADAIFARLPDEQREALRAYAEGVNAALAQARVPPWEFLILGYRAEPWRAEDSLLVILGLYERLSWSEPNERAATVMESTFSSRVADFFFPPRDCYDESMSGASIEQCRLDPVPVGDLRGARLMDESTPPLLQKAPDPPRKGGSNAWAIAPAKSRHARAMLANDMHLDLLVPNIWYRADLAYGNRKLTGLTLPGTPLIISGSNRRVAWGFTNVSGDFSDLILLDTDAKDKNSYLTPQGPRRFDERMEIIRVRGGAQASLVVRETIWGPVLPENLLDKPVAVHWTALDPNATDLKLLDLDAASSVEEALTVLNHAGGPALNALIADDGGHIGWTYTGKIPIRVGFDGLSARSWSDGTRRWQGYIPPEELPRIVDPPSGFIVSANQRMMGKDYPYAIAHSFDGGYRAYRITQRLNEMREITESDMLALQLDAETEFYRYYERIALAALEPRSGRGEDAFRVELRRHLAAWDGKAEPGSIGLAVLVELQHVMAEAVFDPILALCRATDPQFDWRFYRDASLRQVLDARPIELLPKSPHYADWDAFIAAMTEEAARRLMARLGADRLDDLSWANVNVVKVRHPLSAALPWLAGWLDMPAGSQPGCEECVRWSEQAGGATERLVASPGHERDGIFHMPAGQSGHPLSPFYRDQHQDWALGVPTPLQAGSPRYRLTLEPAPANGIHGP